jgi:AraC-like DNA-binding protein
MTRTPDKLTDPTDFVPSPASLDLVTNALSMIRLAGAIFMLGEFTAPWAIDTSPPGAQSQASQAQPPRLILFHIITEGQCWLRLSSGEQLQASEGEVIVLPYGHQHVISSELSIPPLDPAEFAAFFPPSPPPWKQLPVIRCGGGGAPTRAVCGYLHCDDPLFDPVLSALPPLFSVRPPAGSAASWVAASIQYALDAASGRSPSSPHLAVRLPELVFTEVLRLYLASAPPLRTGWLAALRDPIVGPALIELHTEPARRWTVEELARRVACSRSVLNERFVRLLGCAPMQYLGAWRLQIAVNMLRSTALSVAAIAYHVGYESEEAFSRAFKRALGTPPGQWRQQVLEA